MPSLYDDPEHWRERAAGARAVAEKMADSEGRKAMIEIAEKYDRLAAQAVERLAKQVKSKASQRTR